MDDHNYLLDCVMPENVLNSMINTTTCTGDMRKLLQLVQLKHCRIIKGTCEKLSFCLTAVCKQNCDSIELKAEVLRISLNVVDHFETQVSELLEYFILKFQLCENEDELYQIITLFSVLVEHHKSENKQLILSHKEIKQVNCGILNILRTLPRRSYIFTLTYFLPNYLSVINRDNQNFLLSKIFELVKENHVLEIICILYEHFLCHNLSDNSLNLLENSDFWLMLSCIMSDEEQRTKQVVYLLSKSLEICRKMELHSDIPTYLKAKNGDELKIWSNFFLLVDISNEKQLHLIEPSLQLLNSIMDLNVIWRICLYKKLLRHVQNVVTYFVATFIVEKETDWVNFFEITPGILMAINKNEYRGAFKTVFQKLSCRCANFSDTQFVLFLQESLNISWIPTSMWRFYSSIFCNVTNFSISVELLENILKQAVLVPHKYIRDCCIQLILIYHIKHFVFDILDNMVGVLLLIWKYCRKLFKPFVNNHSVKLMDHKDELLKKLLDSVEDDRCNYQNLECELAILQILQIEPFPLSNYETCSRVSDLFYLYFFPHFPHAALEEYFEKRIDSLQEIEDIEIFLRLSQTFCTRKILDKATTILLEIDEATYNNMQILAAFGIMNHNYKENCTKIINLWKHRFVAGYEKIDEHVVQYFIRLLCKHFDSLIDYDRTELYVVILNILDADNTVAIIVILKNISGILKYANDVVSIELIEKCFTHIFTLSQSGKFADTISIFLKQIFQIIVLKSGLCEKMLDFTIKLLVVATSYNQIAYILSDNILLLSEQYPEKSSIFISVIVELILYGIVVSKPERVEYLVFQEIGQTLTEIQDNPNVKEAAVRLKGLEALLNIINNDAVHTDIIVNKFVSRFVECYKKHFGKRYFPNSLIHLHKLRVIQALLVLHRHTPKGRTELTEILIESFLTESHQSSVKHLMQWLLICLLRDDNNAVELISDTLITVNDCRPSTAAGLIPVLYHLAVHRDESKWDKVLHVLLPLTMGPQFKLRYFSQVALLKLYNRAVEKKISTFISKYTYLYESLKQVVETTQSTSQAAATIDEQFLNYFSLESCDFSTIYYYIPKKNGVIPCEWENLHIACQAVKQLKQIYFDHTTGCEDPVSYYESVQTLSHRNENIQKKVTPWKDLFRNDEDNIHTNDFILVTTLVEKPANLGGLSRTCEVFGIKQVVMKTAKVIADKEFKNLSMSSENWVEIIEVKTDDLQKFICEVKMKGYAIIGAEQTSRSVKLNDFQFAKNTVLVLGNEKEGIPAIIIPLLDTCIEIPQFGVVRSLNVHVAGAIAIWEYCRQYRL